MAFSFLLFCTSSRYFPLPQGPDPILTSLFSYTLMYMVSQETYAQPRQYIRR
jgi:hypothetical protein